MSTSTIHFENRVDPGDGTPVLTDCDNTPTLQVLDADDDTPIVVAGTEFDTHVSTGIYEHTFTDPAFDLTYEVTLTVDGAALESYEMPGSVKSAAEQYAEDQAAVSAAKASIIPNANILGQNDGTLDIAADNPPNPVGRIGIGF